MVSWLVLILWSAVTAPAPTWQLPEVVRAAPVIVLARVADPRLDVRELPLSRPGVPGTFQRMRRHLELVELVAGRLPRALRGQKLLRVDEPGWRQRWQAQRARHADAPSIATVRYQGQLAREPVPGELVLAFLRVTRDGLELVADNALDRGTRVAEVRALRGQR